MLSVFPLLLLFFFLGGGAGRPKNHATFIMRCCNLGSHMNFLTLANGVHDQRTLRLDYSSSMCCMFVLAKKVGKWHSKEIYTNNYKYTTFKLHMKHGEQNQSSSIISPFFIVGIHIFLWFFVFAAHCQAITSSFQPQNRSILHWTASKRWGELVRQVQCVIVKQGWQNGDSKTSEKGKFLNFYWTTRQEIRCFVEQCRNWDGKDTERLDWDDTIMIGNCHHHVLAVIFFPACKG